MRTSRIPHGFFFCLLACSFTFHSPGAENHESTVVERGAHRRVWQRDEFITLNDGRVINRPHRTVELSSGLHYRNAQGEWSESRDEIAVTAEGAAATNGPHKVHFTANVNNASAVSVTTPEGASLKTHVIGLAYTGNGQSILFAPIRNSDGTLYPPNQVLYPNAFAGGVLADVRLSYTKAGLESDVILRTRLPSPTNWNMSEEEVLVQVWHEIDEAPEPVITERTRRGMVDSTISFGSMCLVRGGAFALDAPLSRMSGAPVTKTWVRDGNRTFLIESVRYQAIKAELDQLPPPQASVQGRASRVPRMAALIGPGGAGMAKLVPPLNAPTTAKPLRLALDTKTLDNRKGLVLDYVLVNIETNPITLAADQTYYIPDQIYATDVVIEGSTVVKYEPDAFIYANAAIDCRTAAHRPAIFTAKDDDTVGEKISGSTGTPSGNYAGGVLWLEQAGNTVHDLRISYALWGMLVDYDSTLRHIQFIHCHNAIQLSLCTLTLDNSLFYDADRVFFGGYDAVVNARHLTGHRVRDLVWAPDDLFALNLTNSLLVNVTNWGTALYYTNAVVKTSDEAAIQTVGAGAHYLANGSAYRGAGTTNIPAALLSDLRQRTTYPPTVITNATLSTNLTLALVALRGTNVPDLGYAYAPLDYVFGSNVLTNATLTITSGVVLGTFTPGSNTHGLLFLSGANVIGAGQPTNLARIVRYNTVQEQASDAWSAVYPGAQIRVPGQNTATPPSGNFRFTDWSVPEGSPWHLDLAPTNRTTFVFRDCQFTAGRFFVSVAQVSFTNCLFNRADGYAEESPLKVTNRWFNCTAYGGRWDFLDNNDGPWEIFNNAFYDTTLSADNPLNYGYNATLPGAQKIETGASPSNNIVTNIVFQSGPLGDFYLSSTSPLLNRGTNTAADFGLYHFTSTTNQVKETNSTADIGFHHISLNAANEPVDSDADGLPDYTEDTNGNGVKDTSETGFANIDTDYDGRPDGQEVLFDGTDPVNGASAVFTRLAYFPFNDTNWLGSAGQAPLGSSNAMSKDAWLTKGLQIDTAPTAFLKYRDVESDLSANINLRHGALRFWFKSSWDTNTGPGTLARLLDVGVKGSGTTNGWWSLYFSKTNGTEITFAAETNNAGATYLTGTVAWARYDWNQLVLNYTPTNSALYWNSSLIATGLGVSFWPGASVRADGFFVGSEANGTNQAKGLFEDLETFNYPLGTNEIAQNFQTNRPPNAIGDLKLWLYASEATITNSFTNLISTWADQSGWQNHGSQSLSNFQPFFQTNVLNGWPAVQFTDHYLNFTNFMTGSNSAHAFVVLRAETNKPTSELQLWNFGTQAGSYPTPAGAVTESFGSTTLYTIGMPVEDVSQFYLLDISASTTNWSLRINGITKFFTRTNIVTFSTDLELGRDGSYFKGYVAELILYRRFLEDRERQRLIDYLQTKYAILPAPPTPTALNGAGLATNQISLWWKADFIPAQIWTTIERSSGGGAFSEIAVVPGASFIDTNLALGTAYTYRLRASSDKANDSDYSTNLTVSTLTNGVPVPLAYTKIWLKADCGTSRVATTNTNEVMLVWLDQSGHGNHAQQGLLAGAPVFLTNGWNGQPVTRWGTNGNRHVDLVSLASLTEGEAFIVLKTSTNTTPATKPTLWYLGTQGCWYPDSGNQIDDRFGACYAGHKFGTAAITNYTFHLYNAASTGNSTQVFWSGQFNNETRVYFADTNPPCGVLFPSSPRLGYYTDPFIGDILEFILFDHVLSDAERVSMRTYFNSRYNLW